MPVGHRYAGAPEQLPTALVLERLKPWLEDARHRKVGHDIKYDMHVLANYGIALAGTQDDTLLQSYVMESHKSHDLDNLAERHLQLKTITYDELTGKGAKRIPFEQVACRFARREYAAEDVDVTLRLHRVISTDVDARREAVPHLSRDRDPGDAGVVAHGAQRRAARRASCSRSFRASSARKMLEIEAQRARAGRASRSI